MSKLKLALDSYYQALNRLTHELHEIVPRNNGLLKKNVDELNAVEKAALARILIKGQNYAINNPVQDGLVVQDSLLEDNTTRLNSDSRVGSNGSDHSWSQASI